MDSITESLSRLQELSNEDLSALEEAVLNEFSVTESQELTAQTVSTLSQLADAVEAVRAEQARRTVEAESLSDAAAEAIARVKGAAASVEEDSTEEASVEEETTTELSAETAELNVEEEEIEGEEVPEEVEEPVKDEEEVFATSTEVSEELASEETTEVSEELASDEAPEAAPEDAELSASENTQEDSEAELSAEDGAELQEDNSVSAEVTGSESLSLETPADHAPIVKPTTTVTITAGADIPGITAGTKMSGGYDIAEAFVKRLHSIRNVHGGDGEQHIVASLNSDFPEARYLSAGDTLENTKRIESVASPEAVVAAAGVCVPLETKYDLGCVVGVTDRPVRDALARFGADRGGIRFWSAPTLADGFENATGFWRTADDGATWHTYGPNRTTATNPVDAKPCLEVQCPDEVTAYVEAVTLCLTFNNLTSRVFPEVVKRNNDLALVAHARVAENALLAQIEAGSTAVNASAQVVGATREILGLIDRAVSTYRHKHRMSGRVALRGLFPQWLLEMLRVDIAMQMPGDGFEVFDLADAKINQWFRARGVNATFHLDGVGPSLVDGDSSAATAPNFEFPGTIEFGLFAEGTWLFLDGGTLDLGVIRDSSLVATNQYKEFVETFEGVANTGCDSFWVSAAYEPTGSAADLVATS